MSLTATNRDITFRTRYYLAEVYSESINTLMEQIEGHHQENSQQEVFLFVASRGGELSLANAFFRWVRFLGIPLVTIGMGEVASSGVLIFLAGLKRFVLPDTHFFFHPGKTGIRSHTQPVESAALLKSFEYEVVCMTNIVLDETRIPKALFKRLDHDCGVLCDRELVQYGFATAIVSSQQDCLQAL